MATVSKGKDLLQEGEAPKAHKIRITLTSQDVPALEKGEFVGGGALRFESCEVLRGIAASPSLGTAPSVPRPV